MKKTLLLCLIIVSLASVANADNNGFASSSSDMLRMLTDDGGRVYLKIEFEVNSAVISRKALPVVNALGEALHTAPAMKVRLVGHTDSTGKAAHNLKLSEERALAVKLYLEKQYEIAPTRVDAIGMGEEKPIAPNDTAAGRALNRRVEVVNITPAESKSGFFPSEKPAEENKAPLTDTKKLW